MHSGFLVYIKPFRRVIHDLTMERRRKGEVGDGEGRKLVDAAAGSREKAAAVWSQWEETIGPLDGRVMLIARLIQS
jgi:hypothetical protein